MHTKIKTFEDACESLNISNEIPNVSIILETEQNAVVNFYKALIICKALNNTVKKDWKPDWNNYREYKYYPWFDLENYDKTVSGSGFSFCGFALTRIRVSVRAFALLVVNWQLMRVNNLRMFIRHFLHFQTNK